MPQLKKIGQGKGRKEKEETEETETMQGEGIFKDFH